MNNDTIPPINSPIKIINPKLKIEGIVTVNASAVKTKNPPTVT